MNKKTDRLKRIFVTAFFFVAMAIAGCEAGKIASAKNMDFLNKNKELEDKGEIQIIIDPGHGGFDPGKIGANGSLEKEINLEIAKLTVEYLENMGYTVGITRTSDEGLYDENSKNKKRQDMNRRISYIHDNNPLLVVSIHQNSFSDASVCGAQCFYYSHNKESKELALTLQQSINKKADTNSNRSIKADNTYFLLKNVSSPMVIVECGFLSNPEEEKKLNDKSYQDRMAWAISVGIVKYINDNGKD